MTALLEARDLVQRYGAVQALSGVSLTVGEGEFVSIIGPNGAGKTTLVNVLTGLLRPTAGRVAFRGREVAGVGPVRLAALGMARSFQLVNVFPALTVREMIAVGAVSRLGRSGGWWRPLRRDVAIAEAVERAGGDERLGAAGIARAAAFPWELAVSRIDGLLSTPGV